MAAILSQPQCVKGFLMIYLLLSPRVVSLALTQSYNFSSDNEGYEWNYIESQKNIHKGFNSLASGTFQFNFRYVIIKLTLVNGGWGISNEIALRWMPLDLTDDKSTLVQVMAWCRQATSHYLSQCWPRSMSPNNTEAAIFLAHWGCHFVYNKFKCIFGYKHNNSSSIFIKICSQGSNKQ